MKNLKEKKSLVAGIFTIAIALADLIIAIINNFVNTFIFASSGLHFSLYNFIPLVLIVATIVICVVTLARRIKDRFKREPLFNWYSCIGVYCVVLVIYSAILGNIKNGFIQLIYNGKVLGFFAVIVADLLFQQFTNANKKSSEVKQAEIDKLQKQIKRLQEGE